MDSRNKETKTQKEWRNRFSVSFHWQYLERSQEFWIHHLRDVETNALQLDSCI